MNHGRIALLSEGLAAIYPSLLDSPDGPDVIRFCTVHRWASLPTVPRGIPEPCPQCETQADPGGRARYLLLQSRIIQQSGAAEDERRHASSRKDPTMTQTTTPAPPAVTLHPIDSTFVAALGHDGTTLAVQFTNGKVFHYADVPEEVYREVASAPSVGSTFSKLVRSRYVATCIVGKCPKCGDTGYAGETCKDCGTAEYA